MNLQTLRNLFLILVFFCLTASSLRAQTLPATITLNSAVTVTAFRPISIFGNNSAYWISDTDNTNVQTKVQAAGNYFIRYPGGSSSDDYHWNSTGSYDGNNYWVPSQTSYTPGFVDLETYRGTTSTYGTPSNITDGNSSTVWLSNADTDFPNHQWVELDLPASAAVNAVTLVWGTPFAATFVIQYWPNTGWPPPLQSGLAETNWVTTSAGTVGDTGGTMGVTFNPVTAQYFRILMTLSSAGTNGAYSLAEATLYNGSTQVTVNTTNASNQTPVQVSSTDPASSLSYTTNPPGSTDFESYMTYIHSFTPQAIPLITVNLGTGTAQEAAAWVYYANKTKSYGIKYWQIGNETEGNWETGGPLNAEDYVRRYLEYYTAMKAADPTILITGPVAGGFTDTSNMYDGNSYVQDFISLLHGKGDDADINGIDFHWYPNYGNYTAAAALASTSTLDGYQTSLTSWLSSVTGGSTIPVFMSEYNVDPGSENFQVQLGNGLWVADALGRFVTDFGGRGHCNLWDTLNGGSADSSTTGGDLGYLNVTSDGYQYQPRASYWAMQMMSSNWAIAGDTNAHQLISTTVDNAPASLLAAYTDYRPDGILSVAVINKSPAISYNTWITGVPFTPKNSYSNWTFTSANYVWETTTTPYHASTDTAPTTATSSGAASSFAVTFAPYSITVIQLVPQTSPTSTPSSSPTLSTTPTITPTPTLTLTPTFTFTLTKTVSPTVTFTPTITVTPTITPTLNVTGIVIGNPYPNPGVLGPMSIPIEAFPGTKIQWSVFTTAFRKIQDNATVMAGNNIVLLWNLKDADGTPAANGLYYIRVKVQGPSSSSSKILKVLVQR